jgi:4-hydroxybenzoate polyprenyltransferase
VSTAERTGELCSSAETPVPTVSHHTERPHVLLSLLRSMRPKQWTKNLLVLGPLLFGEVLTDPLLLARGMAAFALFCLLCGGLYLLNDVRDRERDRWHAVKMARPVASGDLDPRVALFSAVLLLSGGMGGALLLSLPFAIAAGAFVLLHVSYSLFLKDQVILDLLAISAGFVLRAWAGAAVIFVPISPWLLICAGLLALFLGLAKRRHELLLLGDEACEHRPCLGDYSPIMLDTAMSSVVAATIVTYSLYTFFSPTAEDHHYLMLSVPFVLYGLLRYLYLVYRRNLGGSPEEVLISDRPLVATISLWLVCVLVVLYLL